MSFNWRPAPKRPLPFFFLFLPLPSLSLFFPMPTTSTYSCPRCGWAICGRDTSASAVFLLPPPSPSFFFSPFFTGAVVDLMKSSATCLQFLTRPSLLFFPLSLFPRHCTMHRRAWKSEWSARGYYGTLRPPSLLSLLHSLG